jgi:general nucleoside transport system ATP-binding protein
VNGDTPETVRFDGVTKRFGATLANCGISFAARSGSIHGIVGENGAGKTTLMRMLAGAFQPDAGAIELDGRKIRLADAASAIRHGIFMVHQHFMLVETLTVLENVALGVEAGFTLRRSLATARTRLAALEAGYGLAVELDAKVASLPIGLRQRVEILKGLYRGARILILDEPTAVLTPIEAAALFAILRRLQREGKTIFLVSHKLREIMEVTDRVTILRRGRVVGDLATGATSEAELAETMIGRRPSAAPAAEPARPGPIVLEATGLSVTDRDGVTRLDRLGLTLRRGEITGLAGVAGNGQETLLAVLAGLVPAAGDLVLDGVAVPEHRRAYWLRQAGLAYIPADRQGEALIDGFAAWEQMILGRQRLPSFRSGWLVDRRASAAETRRRMAAYDIRPNDPDLPGSAFSGGNQQKLIAAREMDPAPLVLLAAEPTRGVDIAAIEAIHGRLRALRAAGTAILLVSADLDEILALADRILVMFAGRIAGALEREAASERRLGLMMAGLAADAA